MRGCWGPKKREKWESRVSKSERQGLTSRRGPDAEPGGFCCLPAHPGAVLWCHTRLFCAESVLSWVMHCREWGLLLAAQSLVYHMCHVKAQLRALSQRDPGAGPGDPDLSRSFTPGLTCSQTSPSTPNSQAEGPIPGQAQLQATLLINDC